jgi:RNA polymerase sigma factor (sigma-70 family)
VQDHSRTGAGTAPPSATALASPAAAPVAGAGVALAEHQVMAPPAGRTLHSDPHDFAGLYVRHHWSFTLHARRYLRDQRDADEVVQEAFLRLFLALPELDTELQALAYCRRTITNLCIDRYRTQARRPRLVDLDSAPVEHLVDDDPGDPVVRAEDAALVREALSRLSPLHRDALVKREVEEKTLPVIAQELAIPEDNVKHLLFRARRALRKLLAGTALAPGVDDERGGRLVAAGRAGSGGVGALVLAVALGLGSGPNLEAIPVVGVDLPDVLGVTTIARTVGDAAGAVGDAVTVVVGRVTSTGEPAAARSVEPSGPAGEVSAADGGAAPAAVGTPGGPPTGGPLGAAVARVTGAMSGAPAAAGSTAVVVPGPAPAGAATGVGAPSGGSGRPSTLPGVPPVPADPSTRPGAVAAPTGGSGVPGAAPTVSVGAGTGSAGTGAGSSAGPGAGSSGGAAPSTPSGGSSVTVPPAVPPVRVEAPAAPRVDEPGKGSDKATDKAVKADVKEAKADARTEDKAAKAEDKAAKAEDKAAKAEDKAARAEDKAEADGEVGAKARTEATAAKTAAKTEAKTGGASVRAGTPDPAPGAAAPVARSTSSAAG